MSTQSWSVPYKQLYQRVNPKKEAKFEYPLSNFDSFSYFQTSLSLGIEQRLQKLPKCDINELRLLFPCYILIPRKCPCKTLFKAQSPVQGSPSCYSWTRYGPFLFIIICSFIMVYSLINFTKLITCRVYRWNFFLKSNKICCTIIRQVRVGQKSFH